MNPIRTSAALLALGFVASAPLLLTGCGNEAAHAAAGTAAAPPAPQVTVAEVVQRSITDYSEFTGRFEAVERVELRPRVSGAIESVSFREGAEVKKGDVLYVIDPRPYQATLKGARAELARAISARRQAQTERERAEKLLSLRALSQEEFDARTAGNEKADADVQAAQAAVESAALDLPFTQVRAPIAGVVGRAEITAGNLVAAGQTLLTRLVSIDPIYVRFDGDEEAYLRQADSTRAQEELASQPVCVGLANEAGPSASKARSCSSTTNSTRPPARSRAGVARQPRPAVHARPVRAREARRRCKPRRAADQRQRGRHRPEPRFVYVVNGREQGRIPRRETGPVVEGLRVVRDGLNADECIVVKGLQRVRPGCQ